MSEVSVASSIVDMATLQWVVLLVAAAAWGAEGAATRAGSEPILLHYHEAYGIPAAARAQQAERALDFDGGRIHGGSTANAGVHSHLAGLIVTLADGRQSVCGSSMLTNTRSVTAAHCWFDGRLNARTLTIVFGSDRLFTGGTRVNTNTVAVHASYNPNNLNNDIALISHNFVGYNNVINRVLMPGGGDSYANVWAVAAGFGSTGDNVAITQSQAKKQANLQVISNAACVTTFGPIIIGSTVCARGNNNDSICPGDSGGPLTVGTGNNRMLIGISSFVSARGCSLGMPGGFARVTSYRDWINARL